MSSSPAINPLSPGPLRNTSSLFSRVSRQAERVIVPINESALDKNASTPAFYCVHDVTGSAGTDFVDLAQRLDQTARFYGIQAPMHKMQDGEFGDSIESVADFYVQTLLAHQPEGPVFLGGFCAGAIVALEMAHRLRAAGRTLAFLVAIDAVPENTEPELHRWNPVYVLKLVRNLPRWLLHGGLTRQKDSYSLMRRVQNNARALSKVAMGRRPGEKGEKKNGGNAIDHHMDLSRYPPPQRAFMQRIFAACFDYVASEYPGDVIVYEASTTPLFHLPQLRSRWRGIAPRAQFVSIPGTHLSMLRQPYVDQMATDLSARINAFRAI